MAVGVSSPIVLFGQEPSIYLWTPPHLPQPGRDKAGQACVRAAWLGDCGARKTQVGHLAPLMCGPPVYTFLINAIAIS